MIKLLAAPVRSIVRFPLFQLVVVVAVILFLQAGDDKSVRGQMFNGLDKLVESTVGLLSAVFNGGRAGRYSITSSAATSRLCGNVMPIAFAVFRLITSSNLVGNCTGSSAGFSPLWPANYCPAKKIAVAGFQKWSILSRRLLPTSASFGFAATSPWPSPANAGGTSIRDRLSIRGRILYLSIGAATAPGDRSRCHFG